MAPILISEAELLEALAQASAGTVPEDARTLRELCVAFGLHERRVKRALHEFQRQGRLAVHRVQRVAIDGRTAVVPAYTVRPASSGR